MFSEVSHARAFAKWIRGHLKNKDSLEEEGDTICFIGPSGAIDEIERYDLPTDASLSVERRPAGMDVDEADESGVNETFSYYGT
jgi:hypothetical protein